MKRLTLALVLVLIFAFTLTALAEEKVTLTVEMSVYVEAPHKRVFDLLKEVYEAKNPNVEIVYYGAPYDAYWNKLTAEIVAGTEADIVQLQSGGERYAGYATLRIGETGPFLNLDPYIKGTELEDKLVSQRDLVYNGHYIGISNYAIGMRCIYYRKSMFKEAGIDPDTIITNEDFLEAAKILTKKKDDGTMQYGFGAVVSTHKFVYKEFKTMMLFPIGATYTPLNQPPYEADNIIVGNDAWNWAFKWWQDMIFVHKVVAPGSYDKADERDLWWNGTVAMNIDGPWFVGMTKEYDEALLEDLGVIALPDILYNGKQYPYNDNNRSAITHLVSSNCENPEEAVDFLLWMTTMEAQAIISLCGMIPANLDYSTSTDYFEVWPWNAELATLAAERYSPEVGDPNIAEEREMARIMVDAAQAAFINGDDVTAILDDAAEQIKDLFR